MSRPRESLLTLFDPLSSRDPETPPPFRDVPSPDLGSDKENSVPVGDSPITLTKFFNRIYKRSKSQLPLPLPNGRLIDLSDTNALYDDSDSDNDEHSEHVFNVNGGSPSTTSREDARNSPQRRPLTDIALEGSRSSPIAMKNASPAVRSSVSPFGSPSLLRLMCPTPAPSASPLASVINAINGTTSPSPSPSSPSMPSAPRIAVTPAEPSSPSPIRRHPRPGVMLHASPEPDTRRMSVDLQECLSVHFDESSFDLLKDKISFPENDSLGDLDMDMEPPAMKVPEKEIQGDIAVASGAESDCEPNLMDTLDTLEERLRDMTIEEAVEDGVVPSKNEERGSVSTPPAPSRSCDIIPSPTPQAPVRQFIRPRNKFQVSAATTTLISNGPPAGLPRRSARASISTLPVPTSTAPLRIAKKTNPDIAPAPTLAPIPAPKSGRVRGTALGVQRPSAPAKVTSSTTSAFSAPVRAQPQRKKQTTVPALSTTPSKVTAAGAASSRPSGLRPPMSRVGASGIAPPRAPGGNTKRLSMTSGSRFGASNLTKVGALKGDGAPTSAHMMRRA